MNPWHSIVPPPPPPPTRNLKSPQRWRHTTHFDTHTSFDKLVAEPRPLLQFFIWSIGRKPGISQNQQQFDKIQPIHQHRVPSISIMKQMFPNMPSRGLGRLYYLLFVHDPIFQHQQLNKIQYNNNILSHHNSSCNAFPRVPPRGLGRNCSVLFGECNISQNELQNQSKITTTQSATYICVLVARVVFWPGPFYTIFRDATSTHHLHDCAQRPGCGNNGFACLEINSCNKQTPTSENSMTPKCSPTNIIVKSQQRWRQNAIFDTGAIFEKRFWISLIVAHFNSIRWAKIGDFCKTKTQTKKNKSPTPCSINIYHETFVLRHAVAQFELEFVFLFAHNNNFLNESNDRVKSPTRTPKRIYVFRPRLLFHGPGPRYIILRVAISTGQLDDCSQRPVCGNHGFACLTPNLGQDRVNNPNISVTPNCSSTNPKFQIATMLAPKSERRRQFHVRKTLFCPSRAGCCKFQFEPLGENRKFPGNFEIQRQPTNSPAHWPHQISSWNTFSPTCRHAGCAWFAPPLLVVGIHFSQPNCKITTNVAKTHPGTYLCLDHGCCRLVLNRVTLFSEMPFLRVI